MFFTIKMMKFSLPISWMHLHSNKILLKQLIEKKDILLHFDLFCYLGPATESISYLHPENDKYAFISAAAQHTALQ